MAYKSCNNVEGYKHADCRGAEDSRRRVVIKVCYPYSYTFCQLTPLKL